MDMMEVRRRVMAQMAKSSFKLLKSETVQVTATVENQIVNIGEVDAGSEAYTSNKLIYIKIRDTVGKRNGYFFGADQFVTNPNPLNNSTDTTTAVARIVHKVDSNGNFVSKSSTYGLYVYGIYSNGSINIRARYNNNVSGIIDGTYKVDVYAIDIPNSIYLKEQP